MSNYDAFGTVLQTGTQQTETATLAGTCTGNGNLTVTITASGLAGSPLATSVAIVSGDVPATVATKIRAALALVAVVNNMFYIEGSGTLVTLRKKIAAANDATLNIAYANDTSTGVTDDATSDAGVAGAVLAAVAQVQAISGPSLSLDSEDVTTHDSTGAWEEVVSTILRGGEISFDLVFDPVDNTHDGTEVTGLIYRLKNKVLTNFAVIFPDTATTTWYLDGYVVGFEPDMAHEGATTASATIKLTGQPTLV